MMIKGSKKFLLPIIMGAALTACDIGPDGLGSTFDSAADAYDMSSSSSSSGTQVTINGQAAKGLVLGGVVNIHPIVNGVLNQTPIASGRTDPVDARYNITVQNYNGNPFVVRVTTDQNTRMRCDLAAGCGDGVAFGQDTELNDSSFTLDAIVPPIPSTQNNTSVNLSALTHTATSVALDSLSNLQDTSLDSVTTAVNRANTSVANRFGVVGQLQSLPVVDLTDPASLVGVSQNIIEYNLLNVGVVESMLSGDTTATIANAVSRFSTQFVTQGGLADTETTASTNVTLSEILSRASSVINAIRNRPSGDLINLDSIATRIEANRQLADLGSTEPRNGEVADGNSDELQIVKGMVQSIRTIGLDFEDAFDAEQAMVDSIVDAEMDDIMEALSMATDAIAAAYEAYDADNTDTSFTDPETQITVAISPTATDVSYSVDTSIATSLQTTVQTQVTAVDTGSTVTSTEGETASTYAAAIDLALTGTLTSSTTSLVLNDGSIVAVNATASSSNLDDSEALNGDSMDFDLDVTITDTATENMFDGSINLGITGLDYDMDANMTETLMASTVSLAFAGDFSSPAGSEITASISILSSDSDFNFTSDETEQDYAAATFTIVFETDLAGTTQDMRVSISGTRNAVDGADLSIRVTRGSTILDAEINTSSEPMTTTITNEAGAVLSLTQSTVDGVDVTSGTIVLNGTTYATISDDLGFVVISYNDGFNETF